MSGLPVDYIIKDSDHATRQNSLIYELDNLTIEINARINGPRVGHLPKHSDHPRFAKAVHQALGVHVADDVGYDPHLGCVYAKGGHLSGYFQTYKYFGYLVDVGKDIPVLRDPSSGYLNLLKTTNLRDSLVVHIRRGDYLDPKNGRIGALSVDFFLDAVKEVKSLFGQALEVLIVTDQPNLVKKELFENGVKNWQFVSDVEKLSAVEEMFLLGKGSATVISNSTFSWWGAKLGSQNLTVAPRKWFRYSKDPYLLIPREWMTRKSLWINSG